MTNDRPSAVDKRPVTLAQPATLDQQRTSSIEQRLARVVPRLAPELLHRVIVTRGLEDCGELVALASPVQLARVLDLDLWRADRPGADEQFDPARFGIWIEVLVDAGPAVAARQLAAIDPGVLVAGLAQHALVFDPGAVTPYTNSDGTECYPSTLVDSGQSADIGGYLVVAKRSDAWDAIVQALEALESEQPARFHQVMRGCRSLSNDGDERDELVDHLDAGHQALFDLAIGRERRREQQGFITPAQAGAFLEMARDLRLDTASPPAHNGVARAYFRALDAATALAPNDRAASPAPNDPTGHAAEDDAVDVANTIAALLGDAGLVAPPRALLAGATARSDDPTPLMTSAMAFVSERDPERFLARNGELVFLANVLMAGCSVQGRLLSASAAAEAAAAICNLGLENWPAAWRGQPGRDGVLPEHDLVMVFQVGWTILYDQVVMRSAARLIDVLGTLRAASADIQDGLDELRRELTRQWRAGVPWRAEESLDILSSLDLPAWATLLGLVNQCPVINATMPVPGRKPALRVDPNAFTFISENRQIASVRLFLSALSDILAT